ncbi:ABC transporter permease [Brevibacterium daeguense]|uniref:ABC transporter permease n=1 Tax=Brevibacterium daeguense TaxID=909936 RepID=A0ABP8ENI8_9MICO|nr:ABC transporter permease [Brevibacterium daeguense]
MTHREDAAMTQRGEAAGAPAVRSHAAPAVRSQAAPAVRRVLAQASFEARAILRNGEQLLLSLILPVIVLFGLSLTGVLEAIGTPVDADSRIAVATAGVLGLALASTAFTGQAIATGFDRRYGVLRQLATTPLGTTGLLWGKLIAVVVVVAVQFAVIGTLAALLGFAAPVAFGALAATAVLGTAVMLTWGLLMAGTLRAEATLALANLVWVLMASVGGILFAHAGLWGAILAWTPFGALGNGMRAAVVAGSWDPFALLVMAAWTVLGVLLARRWFDFDGK